MPEADTARPAETSAPPSGESASPPDNIVAGPWINQDGSFIPEWTQHIEPDLGSEPSLRDFKNVQDLARSYVHTKRMVGKRGVIPPTEKSTPQEIAEYRKAIGAPEAESGYDVNREGLPEGVAISEELLGKFRSIANKHHMPQHVWKELADAYSDVEKMRAHVGQQAQVEALRQKYEQGTAELQRAWGRDYQQNMDLVRSVLSHPDLNVDLNSPGLMDPEVVKGFLRLGKLMSDDKFVGAPTGRSAQPDPEKEAQAIVGDKNHPDYHRYHNGDKDVQARVESLFAAAERRRALTRGY